MAKLNRNTKRGGLLVIVLSCAIGLLSCDDMDNKVLCYEHFFVDQGLSECICRNGWRVDDQPSVLNCQNVPWIGSFDDIEYLPSLAVLNLKGVALPDLTPLQQLAHLQTLWLAYAELPNLTAVINLPHLRTLGLVHMGLTGATELAALTNLIALDLEGNAILDVSPLAALTNVRMLNLRNNTPTEQDEMGDYETMTGLNGLVSMTALTSVDLRGNRLDCQEIDALIAARPTLMIDRDPGCVPLPVANLQVTDFVVQSVDFTYNGQFTISWNGSTGAHHYTVEVAESLEQYLAGELIWNTEVAAVAGQTAYTADGELSWDVFSVPDFGTFNPVFVVVGINTPVDCTSYQCWDQASDKVYLNATPTVTVEEE